LAGAILLHLLGMAVTPAPGSPWTDADLLTGDQVIDTLLDDAVLRLRAQTCVLPAVSTANGIRFRRADLDRWIANQRVVAGGGAS
jgi:hypothetical protein